MVLRKFPKEAGNEMITGHAMITLPHGVGGRLLLGAPSFTCPPASWASPGVLSPRACAQRCTYLWGLPLLWGWLPRTRPPDGPDTSTYLTLTACTTHRTRTSTAPPGDRSIRGGADGSYPRGLLPHLPPKGLLGARIYLEKAYQTSWNSSSLLLQF